MGIKNKLMLTIMVPTLPLNLDQEVLTSKVSLV